MASYSRSPINVRLQPPVATSHSLIVRMYRLGLLGNDINMIFRILVIFEMAAGAMMLNQKLQESIYTQSAVIKVLTLKCSRNLPAGMSAATSEQDHSIRFKRIA